MKAARTVLRGDRRSNAAVLPDNRSNASPAASATPRTHGAGYASTACTRAQRARIGFATAYLPG